MDAVVTAGATELEGEGGLVLACMEGRMLDSKDLPSQRTWR